MEPLSTNGHTFPSPKGMIALLSCICGRMVSLRMLCGLLLLAGPGGDSPAAEAPKEYQIKAAFLYNFTKYIEWPKERFPDADSPVVIAILGDNPFGNDLIEAVAGRLVFGRQVVVVPAASDDEARAAHLLFVPAGEERRFSEMAPVLQGASVVTVGESERFFSLGGVITFVRVGDQVRFNINLAVAERDGLKLSAQLLRLATSVRRRL